MHRRYILYTRSTIISRYISPVTRAPCLSSVTRASCDLGRSPCTLGRTPQESMPTRGTSWVVGTGTVDASSRSESCAEVNWRRSRVSASSADAPRTAQAVLDGTGAPDDAGVSRPPLAHSASELPEQGVPASAAATSVGPRAPRNEQGGQRRVRKNQRRLTRR